MIKSHLDTANSLLTQLIKLTEEDLENIKIAKHSGVKESVENKNKLIADFVLAKKNLDTALLELNEKANGNLAEALDDVDKAKLDELKSNLQILHSKNKEYAKLVLIVKEFMDNLVHKMFDAGSGTNNAYTNKSVAPESLFKINV